MWKTRRVAVKMNKHNVIELHDYKLNKNKVDNEHRCFELLDSLKDRLKMSKTYAASLKQYLECMVRDKNIDKKFADNISMQVEMLLQVTVAEIKLG